MCNKDILNHNLVKSGKLDLALWKLVCDMFSLRPQYINNANLHNYIQYFLNIS